MTSATDDIKRVEGVPGDVDFTDPSLDVNFDDRVGRCYELAARYLPASLGDLVHGTIYRAPNPPLAHAWVVRRDGDVFEPTTGHRMSSAEFERYFRPTVVRRYPPEAAYAAMLRTETYGPWEDR